MTFLLDTPHQVICGDCLNALPDLPYAECLFADPPDNIGLKYDGDNDRMPSYEYYAWLDECMRLFVNRAGISWVSYNAKHTFAVGGLVHNIVAANPGLNAKSCVQTFTFGQHNSRDLGNNHRPIVRLKHGEAKLYPNAVRVKSWRQQHGDKRANPKGRVPGDVFDFPRVTGNAKQRKRWCPTQLHEGLVERCILLSTQRDDLVIDPFGGTGTVMRVCKRLHRRCITIERNLRYAGNIAEDNRVPLVYMGIRYDNPFSFWHTLNCTDNTAAANLGHC